VPIPVGAKLGPYEILGPIGAGGMGEVYRAKDPRLGRDVAIKTLPPGLAGDSERLRRFETEARAASLLSHPNILTVFDVGAADGQPYIVSELLEGENLRERLQRGPLPLRQSLEIAASIADALAAAHARGIIHRDLKPENVFLTRDGRVKILDFGIAKLTLALSEQPGAESTATLLTDVGVAVGTLGYMSPEQVRGQVVDSRGDIFALGAVLHEMIGGRPAFRRDSRIETVNAILEADPPELAAAPGSVDRIIKRCLAKDAANRFQSARDLGFALDALSDVRGAPGAVTAGRGTRFTVDGRLAAAAVLLAAGIAGASVWIIRSGPTPVARAPRHFLFQPATAPTTILFDIARDGSRIAFTAAGPEGRQLFIKTLDEPDARAVAGTAGAYGPVFSPDGDWIAFYTGGKLKKIATRGGTPITLCDTPQYLGATWSSDGQITIATRESGLRRVSAEGGTPALFTTPDAARGEIDHHAPHWLPGNRALLLTLHAGPEIFRVAVRSLATGEQRTLIEDGFDARYVKSGHIVYGQGHSLFAAPFDLERLAITGPSVLVVENAFTVVDSGVAAFSVADDGTLVYFADVPRKNRTLVWIDRLGSATPLPAAAQEYDFPTLSPDGRRIAVQVSEGARKDIFVYEIANDLLRRVTLEGAASRPVWSPTGARLTYAARRKEERHLVSQALDGNTPAESLLAGRNDLWPTVWTPNEQALVFVESPPTEISDIKLLRPHSQSAQVEMLVESSNEALWPSLSPDGNWLAYSGLDAGTLKVYVKPLRGGTATQISTNRSVQPRWSRDGRTLFYRGNGRMWRVPIGTSPSLTLGKAEPLFEDDYHYSDNGPSDYDVSPDGRFLMVRPADEERAFKPFHIVLDWVNDLQRRVPLAR